MASKLSLTCNYQYLMALLFFVCIPLSVTPHRVFPIQGGGSSYKKYPRFNGSATSGRRTKSISTNLQVVHYHYPYSDNDFPETRALALIVKVWIGERPVRSLTHMDTGRELVWVQCHPFQREFTTLYDPDASFRRDVNQYTSLYDPDASPTFLQIRWDSLVCYEKCAHVLVSWPFNASYENGVTLPPKMLTLKHNFGATTSVEHQIIFGCDRNLKLYWGQNGILGLHAGPSPQRGRRFSYCVGNLTEGSSARHYFVTGAGAVLQGRSTHVYVDNDLYYVTLMGIAVGEHTLNIDPSVFQRYPNGGGGMILDCGTSLTYLPWPAYQALIIRVQEFVAGRWRRWRNIGQGYDDNYICYVGTIVDIIGFPAVTLMFEGGANLSSGSYPVFYQALPNVFCLNFRPIYDDARGIIGLLAQQGYNVGYALNRPSLYLSQSDCN